MIFLMILEITAVYIVTVCGIIALLTLWEWIIFQLKEEIRIVEMNNEEEE
ncbi:MAG: hypothetical protein K2G14_02360 [Ruminococcus sp.]|nr:hypothetical protein [Ruminococcus sp.]